MPLFNQSGWYLAGGTALALQAGHRKSVDLDFFTTLDTFDEGRVAESMSNAGEWKTASLSQGTLYGEFMSAKASFISYPSFSPADELIEVGSVSILTPSDIAAMKIIAVSQRGRKRDFFDLYWLSINVLPLGKSVDRAQRQYSVRQNINHILKSLVYFDDAEDDPDPDTNFKVSWKQVKDFFAKEVRAIADKIIGGLS